MVISPYLRVYPPNKSCSLLNTFEYLINQLINQLIQDLNTEDNITNMTRSCDGKGISYKHIQGFEKFLKEINISWNFYVDKES